MASKKQKRPTVARAPRQPRAPKVTEKTLGESIIEQMMEANRNLAFIATALRARNEMLSVVTSETAKQTAAYQKVADTITDPLEKTPAAVRPGPMAAAPPVEGEPPRKKRGRPSKAELAAREAARGEEIQKTVDFVEQTGKFPQMCPCGVREDVPKHLHAKGCPVHFPAEPVPAHRETTSEPTPPPPAAQATEAVPAPTLDDVRTTAIAFVGKHGKEKLAALLQKYAAEKLSSVATDKLPALLADLQAAG